MTTRGRAHPEDHPPRITPIPGPSSSLRQQTRARPPIVRTRRSIRAHPYTPLATRQRPRILFSPVQTPRQVVDAPMSSGRDHATTPSSPCEQTRMCSGPCRRDVFAIATARPCAPAPLCLVASQSRAAVRALWRSAIPQPPRSLSPRSSRRLAPQRHATSSPSRGKVPAPPHPSASLQPASRTSGTLRKRANLLHPPPPFPRQLPRQNIRRH